MPGGRRCLVGAGAHPRHRRGCRRGGDQPSPSTWALRPPATPGWPGPAHRWWRSSTRTASPAPDGWTRCWPTSTTPWSSRWRPGSSRSASLRPRRSPVTKRSVRHSTAAPRPGLVRPLSRIPYVPSAALVVRRAALPDELFDPALRGGEDVDLVWRLVQAGWDVRYEPAATVGHDGPTSGGRMAGPPRLLRHHRRPAGPPPSPCRSPPSTPRPGPPACGSWPRRANRSRLPGSWPLPSSSWPDGSTGWSTSR